MNFIKLILFLNFFLFVSLSQTYSQASTCEHKITSTSHHQSKQHTVEVSSPANSSELFFENVEERIDNHNKIISFALVTLEPLELIKKDTFKVVYKTLASRYKAYYSLFTNSPPHKI